MSASKDPNVGIALALVCGAGGATALGASVVFFPSLVKLASRRVLASSLGLSAGVMIYVSFVEIFQKSVGSFVDSGKTEEDAYIYATMCFFSGVIVMLLVDLFVRLLSNGCSGDVHHGHSHDIPAHPSGDNTNDRTLCENTSVNAKHGELGDFVDEEVVAPHHVGGSRDPVGELEGWREKAEAERSEKDEQTGSASSSVGTSRREETETSDFDETTNAKSEAVVNADTAAPSEQEAQQEEQNQQTVELTIEAQQLLADKSKEQKRLVKMGLNTALAIGMHNFPEGLATFVATLDDPRVGAVLALAIGIHNIPEGLCVSLPIYYATGNRCRGFCWALVSGAAEPIAALLGWAVLANSFSNELYAVLFGIVAGMMVIISTKELLPTAHRYDPEDAVVTYSFIGGMLIMALSLVLFVI